ncbi:hypothetical protein [Microbacterium wangchenii]|uniref:hypothetical protein n=1 Tax=Microbacterium wangchenii TaxID=2541726 RepID=UPI0021C46BBD|nr:hypothetical protein [Microbacterium wangchenii]
MGSRHGRAVLDPHARRRNRLSVRASDAARRFRILADGYGLSVTERRRLPDVIEQAMLSCRAFVADRVARGDAVYVRSLTAGGGWPRWDRMQAWLIDNRATFQAALTA